MSTPRLPIIASLVAVYLVWGTTYFAIRVALEGFAPLFQMGIRFVVAGAILMAFQRMRGAPLPTARQWRHCGAVGALLLGCGMGGVATAEQWISSGATTVLIGALPLCAALWSGVFGRRPAALEWLAVLLGSLGIVMLTGGAEFQANPLGTAAILFAISCWSFGSQWSRRLDIPAGRTGFAAEMLLGGTLLLIVSALKGEPWALSVVWRPLLAWIYLVVFGSLIAFSAYMYLVANVSPTLATSYAYVNPPVALIVGAWLGGERIAPETYAALPLVLGSVALLAWAGSRPKPEPGPDEGCEPA